ncbi:RecX family transcriptional regulator [Candidatus Woesearchaeota archaeon]|nr:RecX family transcriptional regulator [Candidatus Woesearchaeota archaeon]
MLQEEGRKRAIIMTSVIIAIALISLLPLLKDKINTEPITGKIVAEKTLQEDKDVPITKTIVDYSYLFLLILVPIAAVGVLSYAYLAKKQAIDASFDLVLHNEEQKQKEIGISLDEYLQEAQSKNVPKQEMHEYDSTVLHSHLKSRLLRGYSSEEIYYELVKHGWKKEKIASALKEMQISQTEAELILGSFMAKSLAQGHDLDTVKQSLLSNGWQPELIQSASTRFEESVK